MDFGDLHTFWQLKKKFDENTVRLLGAEMALALGNVLFHHYLNRWLSLSIIMEAFSQGPKRGRSILVQ